MHHLFWLLNYCLYPFFLLWSRLIQSYFFFSLHNRQVKHVKDWDEQLQSCFRLGSWMVMSSLPLKGNTTFGKNTKRHKYQNLWYAHLIRSNHTNIIQAVVTGYISWPVNIVTSKCNYSQLHSCGCDFGIVLLSFWSNASNISNGHRTNPNLSRPVIWNLNPLMGWVPFCSLRYVLHINLFLTNQLLVHLCESAGTTL